MFSSKRAAIVFSIQYEMFSLTINFKKLTLEQVESSFVRAVSSLPNNTSNFNDKRTSDAYKCFIDKYGTQCVLGVSYGGEINGCIDLPEGTKDFSTATYHVSLLLKIFFENIQKGSNLTRLDYGAIIDDNSLDMFENLCQLPITWKGGEDKFHVSKLRDLTPIFWSCWIDTLSIKFVPLQRIMEFTSIPSIIAKIQSEKFYTISKAVKEHQNETDKENYILQVSENPDRHEWDFTESKQIPKENRKWASEKAETTDTKYLCSIL
eukprot:TRINITY_DN12033_c0_g2_i1.p1 TRINITY_DN12033_c0_g2~~TRINITY_DN12033_c0_g2_i1.p1  ORF type:complete len:264 (+),score=33.97 TRINITY_DN12033_c0_g2_i1:3-794(+)